MGFKEGKVLSSDTGVSHSVNNEVLLCPPTGKSESFGLKAVGVRPNAQNLCVNTFGLRFLLNKYSDGRLSYTTKGELFK